MFFNLYFNYYINIIFQEEQYHCFMCVVICIHKKFMKEIRDVYNVVDDGVRSFSLRVIFARKS